MPLRDYQYKGITDLMKRGIEPTFRALATAGFELADNFFKLHSKGLCYRDISFGNVFFNPDNGRVLICDNDNVDIDQTGKQSGVLGTPRFMAPEIVRGEATPSTRTDLFSLAVLLFYMLMVHHPLEGKKEAENHSLDVPAMTKLYGTKPVFIFDPKDDSNRPVLGYQDNALLYWSIYPQFLKDLFTRAFTEGLWNPNNRVQETEWRKAMVALRDSIVYCPYCGVENFYDVQVLKASGGKHNPCWSCQKTILLPPRMRIGNNSIMLNHDTQLFPHHIDEQKLFDFSEVIGVVTQHPTNPNIWGLKNVSGQKWVTTTADGTVKDVENGRSVTITVGTRVNFGKVEGEIRV
jgi:serine/threonine protein kinase